MEMRRLQNPAGLISSLLFGAALSCGTAALTGPACAQSASPSPELARIIEAAKKEGKVQIKATQAVFGGAAGAKAAQEGMNRMFGTDISVEWTPGPPYAPLAAQIMQEKQAGRPSSTDLYVGTAVQITPYLDRDLFAQIDWAKLMPDRIGASQVEGDRRALRIYTSLPGIVYNLRQATWVPQIGVLADLLKPEYKGKFATTPFLAGFDVLLADEIWGVEKTRNYLQKFSTQVEGLIGCDAHDRMAAGEIQALALDCSGGSPNTQKFRGRNIIGHHLVGDAITRRYGYALVPTHAAHPNAATVLAIYISSPEGQEKVMWDYMGMDLTDLAGSHTRKSLSPHEAKGAPITDVTLKWWQTNESIGKVHLEMTKLIRSR